LQKQKLIFFEKKIKLMSKVKVGIIGLGFIGKIHLEKACGEPPT